MFDVEFSYGSLAYFTISCTISFISGYIVGWYKKRPASVVQATQQFKYEKAADPVKEINKDLESVAQEFVEIIEVKDDYIAEKKIES